MIEITFIVRHENDVFVFTKIQDENIKFTVQKNEEQQYYCHCQFYNQFKLPCIHLLVVVDALLSDLDEIPELNEIVVVESRHFKGIIK